MIIGIDFDGTCCYHRHPHIGEDIPGAVGVLKDLVYCGHKLVLWTCRNGDELEPAVKWFEDKDVPLSAVNTQCPEVPYQELSVKVYCHIFIDDRGLGMPLTMTKSETRPYVNWAKVRRLLERGGYLDCEVGNV